MAVYIEYAIIDNMAFNYCLLLAVSLTLRLKASFLRIFLIAALGCAVSLLLAISTINGVLLTIIKIMLGVTMGFLLSMGKNVAKTLYSILLFVTYTFVLGGIMLACLYSTSGYGYTQTALFYKQRVPLGAYLISLLLLTYTTYNVLFYIRNARKNRKFAYDVTFTINGKTFETQGFLDSGNNCVQDGIPVCFVTDGALQRQLLAQAAVCARAKENLLVQTEFSTLAGSKTALAVKVLLTVNGCSQQVLLAFGAKRREDYAILLNGKVEGLI